MQWKRFNWRLPVRRELLGSHLAVAILLLLVTAGVSYGAFRSYLVANQQRQLVHQATQVARVMQGYFTGAIDGPTANYLVSGLESALAAHIYVVDPVGEVMLSTGRDNVPVAPIPLAAMKKVLWRASIWSGTLPSSEGPLLVVGVPILLPGEVAGGTWLEAPLAPVLAKAWGLLTRLLWAGGLGIGVAWILALVLSDRLARPLGALNRAAGEVAAGRFEGEVPPEGPLEVRELAARFNQMARSLARMVEDLEREARLRDELLAHVAHDLKTPLTTVRGYLEALQDGLLTGSERDRALRIAHAETLRLQRLVARLLEAARLEASLRAATDTVVVTAVVRDVMARLEALARSRGVHLAVVGPETLAITTHRDAVAEVLMNLLTNAITWSPAGGRVTVHVAAEADGVRVTVEDEGPGVSPELADRLFEPFVTGDAARTGQGTGLGLAIARRLATALGGRIGAQNRPEGGLSAWFWLPATVRAGD